MSVVTFTAGKTKHHANVGGSERAYARHIVLTTATDLVLDLVTSISGKVQRETRERILDPPDYVTEAWDAMEREAGKTRAFKSQLALWLRQGEADVLVGGERIGFGELALNTALDSGSAPVRLLAYLQGSCEDHGYFEPPHEHLILAITTGRKHQVLRADKGWEGLVELAREHRSKVLVMSYSVCEHYSGTLKALQEAWWPVDFARHLYADEPQGYLTGRSAFDLVAEVGG